MPVVLIFSTSASTRRIVRVETGFTTSHSELDADPVAVPPGSIEQNCEVTIKEGMLDEPTLNW